MPAASHSSSMGSPAPRVPRGRAAGAPRAAVGAAAALIAAVVVAAGCGSSSGPAGAGTASSTGSSGHAAPSASRSGSAGATASSGPPGQAPVPILMYHVIAPPPAGAPFPGLYVTPSEFAEQMRALKSAGWHAVTMDQLHAYWQRGAPLGAGKPIVLTFDHGYRSQYT